METTSWEECLKRLEKKSTHWVWPEHLSLPRSPSRILFSAVLGAEWKLRPSHWKAFLMESTRHVITESSLQWIGETEARQGCCRSDHGLTRMQNTGRDSLSSLEPYGPNREASYIGMFTSSLLPSTAVYWALLYARHHSGWRCIYGASGLSLAKETGKDKIIWDNNAKKKTEMRQTGRELLRVFGRKSWKDGI